MDSKDMLIIKIRKKINNIANINGIYPSKIYVSKEDLKNLDGLTEIDNVKLEVLKDIIKTDCKFYNYESHDCNAMTELICSYKKCKRYNTTANLYEIECSIRNYAEKVRKNGKEKTSNWNESKNQ